MRPKARTRFDPVVVDDTQLTEPHMPRIEVVVERKAVSALQPFQLRRAAFKCRAYRDHLIPPSPAPIVRSRIPGLPQTRLRHHPPTGHPAVCTPKARPSPVGA